MHDAWKAEPPLGLHPCGCVQLPHRVLLCIFFNSFLTKLHVHMQSQGRFALAAAAP